MLNTGQNAKNKLTVLYARLSKEDEQLGTSGSIANQLKLLEEYAIANGFSPTIRLSDDGYTGTNFNRPDWQEPMSRVESGEVGYYSAENNGQNGQRLSSLLSYGGYNLKSTECYSYFSICSSGIIQDMIGFVANPNSDFDPEYITEILNIQPFDAKKMGYPRRNGNGCYPFSGWRACKQFEPIFDVEMQCLNIVRILKEKVPILLDIKKKFDVSFCINIVPQIYNEESPLIGFNKEIIEFCYLTGTEIDIDIYIYDKE